MNSLIKYRTFRTLDEARAVARLLKENSIESKIEKHEAPLGDFILGSRIDNKIELQVAPHNFRKADELLLAQAESSVAFLEEDYYLFSFSDQELVEIINKPDEWSEQDFVLAKQLLKGRGVDFSSEEIATIKKKRVEEIAVDQKSGTTWLIAGVGVLVVYVIGLHPFLGVLSILSNLVLWQAKKILPDGRKVHLYDAKTSRVARILFFVALIVVAINSILIMRGDRISTSTFFRF